MKAVLGDWLYVFSQDPRGQRGLLRIIGEKNLEFRGGCRDGAQHAAPLQGQRQANKGGGYERLPGTRSFRARGTILNWTGRRASGSPSTWAESGFLSRGSQMTVSALWKWTPSV